MIRKKRNVSVNSKSKKCMKNEKKYLVIKNRRIINRLIDIRKDINLLINQIYSGSSRELEEHFEKDIKDFIRAFESIG